LNEMGNSESITIGVDLGGTKVETGLVDQEGKVLASLRLSTDYERGADAVIEDIIKGVKECLASQEDLEGAGSIPARALGIGVAGQLDQSEGIVRFAPNLKWQDVPLKSLLEKALGIPAVITNDVNAAAYGEWKHGAGQGENDLVALFVGTGIGGGIISNGQMVEGSTYTAGELGHITIVAGGRQCHCPNQGCLEAYSSGWAIAERAREAVQENTPEGAALISLAGDLDGVTSAHVSEAFHKGDPLAIRLVEETGDYLASGVVGIVNALNPGILVLGGGVIDGLPELIQVLKDKVPKRALTVVIEKLKIVKAQLGNKAGSIGAAALARDLL
jgi:glucokinase